MIGGLFLMCLKIIKDQTKMGASSSESFEAMYLVDNIKSLLNNPQNCKASLKGHSLSGAKIDTLYRVLPSGEKKEVYQSYIISEQLYGQNNIKIRTMRLDGGDKELNTKSGYVKLELTFLKINPGLGKRLIKRYIWVHSHLKGGKINECFTLPGIMGTAALSDSGPFQITGENDGLFVPGGKAQIGDQSSSYRLSISEGIKMMSSDELKVCDEELKGAVEYKEEGDGLFSCDGKSWKKMKSGDVSPYKKGEVFEVVANGNQTATKDISSSYQICYLSDYDFEGGDCQAERIDRGWLLKANVFRGSRTSCKYVCHRSNN